MSSARQYIGINMLVSHGQDMKMSAKPMIEPLAILYNNNQLTKNIHDYNIEDRTENSTK